MAGYYSCKHCYLACVDRKKRVYFEDLKHKALCNMMDALYLVN